MPQRLIKLLPVAAALAFGSIAQAASPAELPRVVVSYGDLDLNKPAGVVALHARLRNAAERVCQSLDSRVLGLREEYQHCLSEAVADSVAAIGNDSLIQYHRSGRRFNTVAAR